MAAKLSQSLEEHVTCPICLDQYQDPRILPCQHTYCRKCLDGLLDKGSRRFSIQCPECRETFQIENVNSLKVNIWVNRNIALLEQSKTEDQKVEAVLCDKHKGKKLKLFCEQCETLICKDCTLIDHKDHKFAFIADVVEKHKGQLQKKMQHVCGTKKKIKSDLKAVKDMQERVRKNEKKIKKEIDEKIDVKIAILEKMRAKLKQESTNLTATKMKRLSLQQDGLEMQLAGLTSAVEFTENILVKGSNNDVLSMKTQIESRLTELSDKEIDFEVDEKYEQILQVNEIPNFHEDIVNYLVIKDRFAPDPEKCTVGWIEGTSNIFLQVRNYFGEPINIKANRVQIDCPRVHVKSCTKTGEFLIESRDVIFKRPSDLHRDDTSDGELKNLEVQVDGLSVRGSPLEVITKCITVWQIMKSIFI